jgi:hypothetical protein
MPETALWNLPAANEPTAAEPRAQFSTVEAAREFYQRPPCWSGSSICGARLTSCSEVLRVFGWVWTQARSEQRSSSRPRSCPLCSSPTS